MSEFHHPSSRTLARFAAGTLEPGPALVVAAHLDRCPHCARAARAFEAVGGVMLESMEAAPLSEDAFLNVMARLDDPVPQQIRVAFDPRPAFLGLPEGIALPRALAGCEIGPWKRFGPGARWSYITLPGETKSHARLMRIGAGRKMPHHTHTGTEFTLVLSGSFHDENARYGPGDLSETDDEVEHQPVVDTQGECICLAAMEGEMRLPGLLGVLARPFVRF